MNSYLAYMFDIAIFRKTNIRYYPIDDRKMAEKLIESSSDNVKINKPNKNSNKKPAREVSNRGSNCRFYRRLDELLPVIVEDLGVNDQEILEKGKVRNGICREENYYHGCPLFSSLLQKAIFFLFFLGMIQSSLICLLSRRFKKRLNFTI